MVFHNWYDHVDPRAGGVAVFLREVSARLSCKGYQVAILVRRPAGGARREFAEGCQVVRLGRWAPATMVLSALQYQFNLRRRADVVVEFANKIPYLRFCRMQVMTPRSLSRHP